jgi:hypothetical protein
MKNKGKTKVKKKGKTKGDKKEFFIEIISIYRKN